MRSLRIVRGREVTLKDQTESTELSLSATAWDPSTDSIICAFGPSASASVIELRRQYANAATAKEDSQKTEKTSRERLQLITSWDAPCPLPDLPQDRIISLHYFADTLMSCVVLEGGDIIAVREDPQPGEEKIEILGSVDAGITGAAWTPDEELLAITTRENTLLFMTRDFENAVNTAFSDEDLKVSQHVSVGWGKRETQFQGKRAKALRDPTVPETIDEGKPSQNDDGRVSLSWRGDGAYLAISSVHANSRRLIRVYSRDGTLDSVSEPVNFLEGALSWRPVGNLIAGIQRFKDRIDVVFFERNGLRHGQFALRLTEEEMQTWANDIQLSWNIDSTVLAVIFKDRVQFWTTGNYHYYLKQEVLTTADPSENAKLLAFKWHQEKALKCTIGSEVSLLDMEFSFDVNRGTTVVPCDVGTVAVVDGKNLKLSALKRSNPPPPIYGHEVPLNDNAVDVAFSKSGIHFAVLTNSHIAVYSWQLKSVPIKGPVLECTIPFANNKARHTQVVFVNEDEIYVSTCPRDSRDAEIERMHLETKDSLQIPSELASTSLIFTDVAQDLLGLYSQDQKRFLLARNNGLQLVVDPQYYDFPNVDAAHMCAVKTIDDEYIIVTLTKHSALYANTRLLAKNCTSFVVTSSHIIFTTSQHLLKFVHLNYVEALEVPDDTPEGDERCRAIERGARIVTVVPSRFAVTLQMPRGNTETIFPRALVLSGIRKHIDKLNYRAAFMACRAQMVDMNLLHDYNPTQFMAHVPLFIDQVKDAAFIDEFLSRLSNEDVSRTTYKDASKPLPPTAPAATIDNKVNKVCDAFIEVLASRVDTHLRNLVTAHVCKFPPDLEAGLQLAAKLRDTGTGNAEEAVEHMCFLTDAGRLYDHALGLYDLALTLMVAQQAQRDPREYLPFLQKLQEMPEHRKRFEIDNYLGRHNKAIKSLHTLGSHQELRLYAVKHSLYSDALDLYADQPELFREMAELHADHLRDLSNHKEAAIAYESLGFHEAAYQSYNAAHMWQECLYNAALVPLDENAMRELAREIAVYLVEVERDYISASKIHEQHLDDIPLAAHFLCRGYQFAEACRILGLHRKQDLIPNIIDSGIGEAMGNMVNLIADCKGQLNAQVPRIKEIRAIKATDPLKFYGGDPAVAANSGYDIPDNISLAPTEATTAGGKTLFTRYTKDTRSTWKASKARRKEERKRASGKKGTIYEEEYLVNSVRRLIERVNGVVGEVEKIIEALLRRAMRERASFLQESFKELQRSCVASIDALFETSSVDTSVDKTAAETEPVVSQRPAGGEGVIWDSVQGEDSLTKSPPPVRELKVSSLLGHSK